MDGDEDDLGEQTHAVARWLLHPLALMYLAVVAVSVIPVLGFRQFYLAGDTIASWLPVSRRIGELLLDGESHLMDPTLWRGGNFVASARYGVWNPIALGLDVTVLQLDDLVVAMVLVSAFYLSILATGVYLLAREYGGMPWAAAVGGVVMATGGWTLWMDAAWWTPHLASLAFTPFVWLTARRVARGVASPIWFVLAAVLCVTVGNPYSAVVVLVIVVGVVVEHADRHRLGHLLALGASLVSVGLITIFIYIPFRQTSGVGFRETGIFNDESWSPGLGDLLAMSSPTASPIVPNFGRAVIGFPAAYLSWFMLPLAPWLSWRALSRRHLAGLAVFAGVFLLLALGPSNFWFFRWPMRLIPYLHLPVVLAVSIVLGRGLIADRRALRGAASAAVIVVGAYLAWADVPDDLWWHLAGAAALLAATAVAVWLGIRRPQLLGAALIVGTVAILVVQLQWKPFNESVRQYAMPDLASAYEASFGDRYGDRVVQIAQFESIPTVDRTAEGAYRDITIGSTYRLAGLEAITAYSGIGFTTHDAALCLRFDGAMCANAWATLWQPSVGSDNVLIDRIGADTVVVQRSLIDTVAEPAPPGWEIDETTEHVVVWKRQAGPAWPDGRLTEASGPIVVAENVAAGAHDETVSMRRIGDGEARLTFARLAWPGYVATIDGRSLLVGGDSAGLLTVTIPPDVGDGKVVLTWVPPYWRPSLAILLLGVAVAIVTQVLWMRCRQPDRAIEPRG